MKGVRNPVMRNDVKESFDAGPAHDKVHPTPWPKGPRCHEFREFMEEFMEDCLMVHHDLLHLLEEALDLNHEELTSRCEGGNGEVRITHYPPVPVAQLKTGSTYRISEHTDVGILTLLFQDSVGGLEVERQDNSAEFIPVESSSVNEMIVNCGDTIQMWTANYLRSANHRVTYPPGLEEEEDTDVVVPARYSVGFFGKADMSASMSALPKFASSHSPGDTEAKSAQEYYNHMHERTVAAA
jgi:isopenicillin N synthase-like dioxygenase